MLNNQNTRLSYLAKQMIYDSDSIINNNIQVICERYGLNYYRRENGFNQSDFKMVLNKDDQMTVATIQELRGALNGDFIPNFSREEINCIIESLCCD